MCIPFLSFFLGVCVGKGFGFEFKFSISGESILSNLREFRFKSRSRIRALVLGCVKRFILNVCLTNFWGNYRKIMWIYLPPSKSEGKSKMFGDFFLMLSS